ncbi:MAG: DUF2785 domain-containing protein [Defluviitaleaceae bacterium]|nr:DUF2785 domain-containing protein [Defluviitaleaceae bacterium]MCL2836824.1 DUF2785 domain-containing protein [Defluviitaleaceae bacterium]
MEKYMKDLQDMPVAAVKEMDLHSLVNEMLENVGNANPNIRENICKVFYRLIDEDIIDDRECIRIFNACLNDSHLFYGIGSKAGDSVFCRSFSSLVIAFIADTDGKRNFLSQDQYMYALRKSFDYMNQEADRRGYVADKGWAHAVAHGADMLCAFAEHPKFDSLFAGDMLNSIKHHITYECRYTDAEEERLAYIIPALLNKGVSVDVIQDWISGLAPDTEVMPYTDEYYQNACSTHNIVYFLKSLYIMLDQKSGNKQLKAYILQYLKTVWNWAL